MRRREASKDGAAHVACGVFEGTSMVCGATQGDYNYNYVSKGEPNAFRAYTDAGCRPKLRCLTRRWRASSCSWDAASALSRRRGQSRCTLWGHFIA